MISIKNFLVALILTLIVIALSYFFSKSIEQIIKEREIAKEKEYEKETETSEYLENVEIEKEKSTKENENSTTHFPFGYSESIGKKSESEEKIKIINYTKFEKAYIYDFCYAEEEKLSIEGRNLICLNEVPKIIRINLYDDSIKIFYNDLLVRNVKKSNEILLGYAFAKDFYGVEGEIIEFFTNSTFTSVGDFDLGEISYFNETTIYASFPVYVNIEKVKNEDLNIFVKTLVKNYIISSIKIIVS